MPPHEGCRLPLNVGLLPLPVVPTLTAVTHPHRSTSITPASSLLRGSPPLADASLLSASRWEPLVPFRLPSSDRFSSPHESPNESHAPSTPDIAWPVGRLPPCSSRNIGKAPVLMSPKQISMLERRFTCVRLSHSYLTRSLPRLLTMTFTTAVFGRSSSWRFGAFSYKTAPKGPLSSFVQHDADRASVFMTQCHFLP